MPEIVFFTSHSNDRRNDTVATDDDACDNLVEA